MEGHSRPFNLEVASRPGAKGATVVGAWLEKDVPEMDHPRLGTSKWRGIPGLPFNLVVASRPGASLKATVRGIGNYPRQRRCS